MLMEPLLVWPSALTTTQVVRNAPGCCCRLLMCLKRLAWRQGMGRLRWVPH